MTLKHALAELPYGGAKSVVLADGPLPAPGSPERVALMERYGDFVARTAGSYVPGVRAFCDEVAPGPCTGRGVYAAMRAAVRHALGRGRDGGGTGPPT
ncbi:hypothetical protein BJF81_00960 [Ornithinimicrobium sp. CNJ-824]|uniref:hypothetical protein n=1 Tax=Ornithinimicrobium sp. CNJ-824 TaxID=1904966 RepID=UPI000966ACFA|nr:hypothetical protein [Ornithinimicrobium sp. CNJ-824]OLT22434.1 hypothetical protein BJF81_00960 [Ornithinimicrobium sp. CNJ-824]